ncbi:EAL domain-containing protein [Thalassotalea sp. M1531]|uniref:EAL domain-containing protein n=1 Tax=Thalassotalea algicola TaxID=2716224 RepID=A0A7Y0LA30_9GAMM|nr:EAL domain-containing protein [Thalassotalea algicola]NMP30744.1 EAL domain-containing protein [Thalassotalea algicola]
MSGSIITEDKLAQRQIPKLKSLLKKYRQVKTMQASLLQLSELASTVTDLNDFYASLVHIIDSLLTTNSVHIALANPEKNLEIVYCHNPVEDRLAQRVEFKDWRKGLTGLVFLDKAPLHCSAAERMALAKAGKIVLYGSSFVDWLGVPLRRGNQVIGVIALQSYDHNLYFDDRDCQLLEFIAEHIVTAIDRVKSRAMLEQCIEQRTRKLTDANRRLQMEISERQKAENMHQVLLEVSAVVASTKELSEVFSKVHQQIARLITSQSFYIATKVSGSKELSFPYYQDEVVVDIDASKRTEIFVELALKAAKPVLISQGQMITLNHDGTKERMPYLLNFDKKNQPQTWLAAPLMENNQAIGVIATQHYFSDDVFEEKHLELFRFVAQQVASAIVRERDLSVVEQSKESLELIVNERTEALQATNLNLRMQIEERRKAESRLYYEAHHDALTKLPNRAMFTDRLTHALRHMKRHPERSFAVLFIDLDRFKVINDTLGHHTGDKFLIEIASRLTDCVRDNDVLARLGGDEFVILLDSPSCIDDVEEVADRIITAIEQPFEIDGNSLYSNASIGIAQCAASYQEASEILRDADAAMYQAKSLGRGRYVFFDDSMREQLLASMTLEQELRVAIKEGQFELHYQQISDLAQSHTIGFEALLRWQHPSKGLLTPSEFLFMAEETGMILDIEHWIIQEVGMQLKLWQLEQEYQNALIGINLSGRYLTQPNQLKELLTHISNNHIEPQRLIIEFSESAISQQPDLALASLKKLRKIGVKLALDDYGASSSSFNYIHNYPFEFIKLDRSLTRSLGANEKHLALVTALQALGNQFGYRLVAEGIESEEVLEKLKQAGCDFGQGYHIAKPARLISTEQESDDKSCA